MIGAIIAAMVAIVVAILTPAVTSLRSRRQAVNDKFDEAVAALLLSQTARHYPNNPGVVGKDWKPEEFRLFSVHMQQDGAKYFMTMQEKARASLARLETFVPELRQELTRQWEIGEDREPGIKTLVEARRREAVKSERLFRLRRPPGPLPAIPGGPHQAS